MCGALKLSGIVRANVRLNIAIPMLFVPKWVPCQVGENPRAIKIKLALPPPPFQENPTPPLKGGILWAWGFFQQKEPKVPGAHKIGAAISGPRIGGGNFMDTTLFLRAACLQNEAAPEKL